MGFPAQPPPLHGVVHIDVRVDRSRWHVATAGDPEAPPLVLLHGWPQHWWMWRKVIAPLAQDFRVYAPDLRGFGWSDAPEGKYSKMGLAADVEKLLDVLEIDRCVIAGHDWGGFVAWLLAIRAQERLERLVTFNIIHPWWRLERSVKSIASGAYMLPMVVPGVNRFAQPWTTRPIRRIGAPHWGPEEVRLYGEQYRRPEHAAAATAMYRTFLRREMPALTRGRYDNRRVTIPVTCATGGDDPVLTPDRVMGAEAHVDDLNFVIVEGAGHFMPESHPQRAVELIRDGR